MAVSRRRTVKAMAAAGLAVGAVTVAVPANGVAAPAFLQDDRLGEYQLNPNRTPAELDRILNDIKRTRTKAVRINIFWGAIAPTKPANPRNHKDPAYNWARTDAVVNGLRAKRLKIMAAPLGFANWAAVRPLAPVQRGSGGQRQPYNPYAPRRAKDFQDFMEAFSRHYNGRQNNPNGPGKIGAVRMISSGNEPNLKNFFRTRANRSNIVAFAKVHRAAWKGIRRGNPRAKVMLAAFGPNSSGRNGNISARRWLNGMMRQRNLRAHIIEAHIYGLTAPKAANPRRVFPRWDSIAEIQRTIRRSRTVSNRRLPIMVTEAGWTTARTPFRRGKVTVRQQARYIRQLFQLPSVRTTRGRNPIAGVVIFNYKDNVNWPGGLVRANGRKKPAYNVFRSIARKPIPARYRKYLV